MIISIPTENEPTYHAPATEDHDRYVRWYLDCTPWKCPTCGSVCFGRCICCAYCKHVLLKETPRPDSYSG